MEKLLAYLNSLPIGERKTFADRCGTTEGYLRKACSTKQRIGAGICVQIERESGGQVTRKDLRDDWILIWPELSQEFGGAVKAA